MTPVFVPLHRAPTKYKIEKMQRYQSVVIVRVKEGWFCFQTKEMYYEWRKKLKDN